tara:strand:+ start:1112 stop:1576 length:465 start_codon:yes stop_codon:yes gene_type:complete
MGNLTRDPELRTFASGTAVCNFGMAINRNFTDREGNRREETTFVDLESFGKQAETISRYMKKGSGIFIEGRLKLDQWEKDGEKRSKLKITLENFQFVGGGEGAPSSGNAGQASKQAPSLASDLPSPSPQDTTVPSPSKDTETQVENIEEDDVPF